eukprot:TRINITY_DN8475_c0_g1_i1.p1 TRINITY_DN8475_c0_g1~~TRINITY_DN8475_c0_g1_i1.p1  ORF type:complete len:311 (-),score=54.66 TRINITY_DN8475_c0_g1_i1:75-1007(-)
MMKNTGNLMMMWTPLLSPSLPMSSPVVELSNSTLDLISDHNEPKPVTQVLTSPRAQPTQQVTRRRRVRGPDDKLDVEALGVACATNNLELVKILVSEKQVDPNWVPSHGLSPLVLAVANGNAEVAWYLLENGAEQKVCKEGITPLLIGSQKRQGKLCFLLLLHQLMRCARRGDFTSFRELFSFQTPSSSSTSKGRGPGAQFYFDLLCFDSWGMILMSLLLLFISLLFVHFPVSFRKRTPVVTSCTSTETEQSTNMAHSQLKPGPLITFLLLLLSKTYAYTKTTSSHSSSMHTSNLSSSLSLPFPSQFLSE